MILTTTTSSLGQVDIEIPYISGPPDGGRYPDFSNYSNEKVNISNMTGKSETDITPPDVGDFSKAWNELESRYSEEYIMETYNIKKRTRGIRSGNWPDKSPRGLTWHHNGDTTSMELIDLEIHKTFTHSGGASISRQVGG